MVVDLGAIVLVVVLLGAGVGIIGYAFYTTDYGAIGLGLIFLFMGSAPIPLVVRGEREAKQEARDFKEADESDFIKLAKKLQEENKE